MFGPVISISFPVQVKIPLFQDLNHLPEQYSLFGDLHVKIFSYDTIEQCESRGRIEYRLVAEVQNDVQRDRLPGGKETTLLETLACLLTEV